MSAAILSGKGARTPDEWAEACLGNETGINRGKVEAQR